MSLLRIDWGDRCTMKICVREHCIRIHLHLTVARRERSDNTNVPWRRWPSSNHKWIESEADVGAFLPGDEEVGEAQAAAA